MELRPRVKEGAKDLRYLLSRGYNREGALRLVGDKYRLNAVERSIIYRCVYDPETARRNREKLHPIKDLDGASVAVDGYNTIITVESYLNNQPVIISDDGFVRDASEIHRRHRITPTTSRALREVIDLLSLSEPAFVAFFYDVQMSRSGELAEKTRVLLEELEVPGDAQTARYTDREVLKSGAFVSSSDYAIIRKAEKIVDLAGELIQRAKYPSLIRLE